MKKLSIFFIMLVVSCTSINKQSSGTYETRDVNRVEQSSNLKDNSKLQYNVQDDGKFRKQQISDSIINVKIGEQDVKIIYIKDKLIFDRMKKVFESTKNVGILYRGDFLHLGCTEDTYDVIFIDDEMTIISKGIKIVNNNQNAICSTKMIKNMLLLPKNLVNVENINVGDIVNLDYSNKIPLNKNMID